MSETQALQGFDALVENVMKDWKVPGCAVAVVKDGATLLSKGYGLRDTGNNLPVTTDTLFAIGSCTKAFTCMALGMLVDDGKLDWDKPVREYVPAFRLYDPTATELMTPRDLVTHRSGLPRHDLIWYGTAYTRQQIFERLRHLEPSKSIRALWQYNNLMYMVAGVLIEQVTGCTWEEFVRQRILDPLGMRGSNLSVSDMQRTENFARPYHEKDDQVTEVPFHNLDAIGPAGSINSSVNEMVPWLLLHLNKGRHGDQQLISEASLREMHTPQMVMPPGDPEDKEMGYASYGLGWSIGTYREHLYSVHGGGIDGFASIVIILPRKNAGIVVLSNCGSTPLPTVLGNNLFDRQIGLEPVDWHRRLKERTAKAKQMMKEAEQKGGGERKPDAPPTHPLQDYTGTYEHPGYGPAVIRRKDDHLEVAYGLLSSELKHVHFDTFEFVLGLFTPPQRLMFQLNLEGDVNAISVPVDMGLKPLTFTRAPEEVAVEKGMLEQCVGTYELMGMSVRVTLRGQQTLILTVPGQPQYELVPFTGERFRLKGVEGFSVEFTREGGQVTGMVFHQPNGDFPAKRQEG